MWGDITRLVRGANARETKFRPVDVQPPVTVACVEIFQLVASLLYTPRGRHVVPEPVSCTLGLSWVARFQVRGEQGHGPAVCKTCCTERTS